MPCEPLLVKVCYVFLYYIVVGIYLKKPYQQFICLHMIALFAVDVYLTAPPSPAVWIIYKQLVDVTNGAGVIMCLLFYVHKGFSGLCVCVVIT